MQAPLCPYPPDWLDPSSCRALAAVDHCFSDFLQQVRAYLRTLPPDKRLRLDRYSGQKLEYVVRSVALCYFENDPPGVFFADDWYLVRRFRI